MCKELSCIHKYRSNCQGLRFKDANKKKFESKKMLNIVWKMMHSSIQDLKCEYLADVEGWHAFSEPLTEERKKLAWMSLAKTICVVSWVSIIMSHIFIDLIFELCPRWCCSAECIH